MIINMPVEGDWMLGATSVSSPATPDCLTRLGWPRPLLWLNTYRRSKVLYSLIMRNSTYSDTRAWEPWQAEYQYGAFYIFPPKGIIEPVDELRRMHDPRSYAYCQAHGSLSEPLKTPPTEEHLQELGDVLSTTAPFSVHYGPLRSFPPYPGVVYAIQPEDAVMDLRSLIHSTSLFAQTPLKRQEIKPHMTIAELITLEATHTLLQELDGNVPEGSFFCDNVEYAIPNERFHFERVITIQLGGRE